MHLETSITRHKAHIKKCELLLRLLDNDELSPEQVNDVKDFLEDYVERNQVCLTPIILFMEKLRSLRLVHDIFFLYFPSEQSSSCLILYRLSYDFLLIFLLLFTVLFSYRRTLMNSVMLMSYTVHYL